MSENEDFLDRQTGENMTCSGRVKLMPMPQMEVGSEQPAGDWYSRHKPRLVQTKLHKPALHAPQPHLHTSPSNDPT